MPKNYHIEINCQQINCEGERICGDVFLHKRVKEENRIVAVLSDGMGHGVKANVLATLTATMAANFTAEHRDFGKIAEIIMSTLPVCSERGTSYSTFTIVDIEEVEKVSVLEYDNPEAFIIRNQKLLEPGWQKISLNSDENAGKILRNCSFIPEKEDRIVFCSDGVTQSGLGSKEFSQGWGRSELVSFVQAEIRKNPFISAEDLSERVVKKAFQNDNLTPKDDISCAVIYFREPRKMLICTGPPYDENKDSEYAEKARQIGRASCRERV